MELEDVLDIVNNDIKMLQNLLLVVNEHVNELTDPLLVQVSQLLDRKLNQRDHCKSSLYPRCPFAH